MTLQLKLTCQTWRKMHSLHGYSLANMKLWSVCTLRTSNRTICSIIWPHSNWRWQNEQIDTQGEGVQVINNGYRYSFSGGVTGHRKISCFKVYQPFKAAKSLFVKIFFKKKKDNQLISQYLLMDRCHNRFSTKFCLLNHVTLTLVSPCHD